MDEDIEKIEKWEKWENYVDDKVNDLLDKYQKEIYEMIMLGTPIYVYHKDKDELIIEQLPKYTEALETLSEVKMRHYVKTLKKYGEVTHANPTK